MVTSSHQGPRHRIAEARKDAAETARKEQSRIRTRKIAGGLMDALLVVVVASLLITFGFSYEHLHLNFFGVLLITGSVFAVIVTAVRFGVARALREDRRD